MATDLETKPGVPKYEAFVETQLARVRTRIRALEAGRSLMMLGALTLAYFLLMAVFDLAVNGADDAFVTGIRLAAFGAYVVLLIGLLGQLGLRLYRRINPFYAAKQLEDTLPDAKNSVINWLDLKERELPGAIRSAVGQRAARELKQTDPDRAVNPKSNWVLGGILAGLGLGLLILFALGPNQFSSLLQRAFTPFFKSGLGTKTEIILLRPQNGAATVPLNQRVDFQARIEGRFPKLGQPGAPRLLYRYQTADAYVPLPLDEGLDGNWSATLLGDQVLNGFWYKIAAGDAETAEYQIKVQSLPHAQRFEVAYHYRPYRKLADDKVIFPNEQAVIPRIIDYRGTEIDLVVRTNRSLRQARVEVDCNATKSDLVGAILPDDPKAFRVHMKLEQRGTFRVLFTSKDGEENTDRSAYQIEVLDDQTPHVLLTTPGKDISLPANGTLRLEGTATDDIGLTSLALRLKVLEGESKPQLQGKSYREGKSMQFDNGTYPDFIDYKDFVALNKLTTAKGEPFPLKVGTVLEYWLEATDNSDYPNKDGNVGKSAAYKVTILAASPDQKKQQEDRKNAANEQKKHEQKQDQQSATENNKRNQGQAKNDQQQDDQKKQDFENKRKQVQDQVNKDKEDQQKGKSKGQEPKLGDSKTGESRDNNKADQKESKDPKQAGEKKDAGKDGQRNQSGQAKDEGAKDQSQSKPSEAKGPGPGENKAANGQAKGNQDGSAGKSPPDKGNNQGAGSQEAAKAKNKGGPKDQAAQVRDKGGSGSQPETTSAKNGPEPETEPQGLAKGGDETRKADAKAGGRNPQLGKKEGNGKTPGAQAADSKGPDPKEAESAAIPKDGQSAHAAPRDGTGKDVNDLKQNLQSRAQAAQAHEELTRLAKEANDPDVRKAAQEALDGFDQQAKASSQSGIQKKQSPAAPPEANPKDNNQQGSVEAGKPGEPKTGANAAKGAGDGQGSEKAKDKTKPGGTIGNSGPDGRGVKDDLSKQPPNADFQKKAGDLQLETLKERVTPETLKKLGWSEDDWRQFLSDAQKYQVRRVPTVNHGVSQKGMTSQIPGSALRAVDINPTAPAEPLVTDRALAPPEFRNAQRQFSTSPSGKQ